VGTPTTAALIALYVSGLILLDGRQTQTRVARFLPARAHDALNRLLRVMPLSTRALMALLGEWVRRSGMDGYLCIDDVVVEKAFAKRLPWAGWTYSFAKKRKVYGVHVVVLLLWCASDGGSFRIPVAFRLWRPKRSCTPRAYKTKLRLAEVMLKEVIRFGAASPLRRLRHSLQRWVVHKDGWKAGPSVGRHAPSEDDCPLAQRALQRGRVGQGAAF
jgi:hypothetical protein